jgi:hypothetical protein
MTIDSSKLSASGEFRHGCKNCKAPLASGQYVTLVVWCVFLASNRLCLRVIFPIFQRMQIRLRYQIFCSRI